MTMIWSVILAAAKERSSFNFAIIVIHEKSFCRKICWRAGYVTTYTVHMRAVNIMRTNALCYFELLGLRPSAKGQTELESQ